MVDINQRAWDLYRDVQLQRARLKSYEDALGFVRVRQMEAVDTVKPIADKLWEISERMKGGMDPSWPKK